MRFCSSSTGREHTYCCTSHYGVVTCRYLSFWTNFKSALSSVFTILPQGAKYGNCFIRPHIAKTRLLGQKRPNKRVFRILQLCYMGLLHAETVDRAAVADAVDGDRDGDGAVAQLGQGAACAVLAGGHA